MKGVWSFHCDGVLTGQIFSGSEEALALNTPAGCGAVYGVYDYLSKRVDPATGAVYDWVPPQPSDMHEWDGAVKRWVVKAEELDRITAVESAQATVESLEARMIRPLSELTLDPTNVEARAVLEDLVQQIVVVRPVLKEAL